MWIDLITGDIAETHSDIRQLRPNWSAPFELTEEMIEEVGFTTYEVPVEVVPVEVVNA